jgi:uncharacterized protein YdhG (YjbR/CyaY superfamily)
LCRHEKNLMTRKRPGTIAEYIDQAPDQAQAHLRRLYALLKGVAPDATEAIKWGNPVFESKRILFAFSAHKEHINFAPTPAALAPFRDELVTHKTGKATLQIPYKKPIPVALVRKIAKYRVKDVLENDAKWM